MRPKLDALISLDDFNDFYWLKTELIHFCRQHGISPAGSKIDIAQKIRHFLITGQVPKNQAKPTPAASSFDWRTERLTRETVITDNYTNGENVRQFFTQEIGPHFAFNVVFMKWMRENIGKTLGEAITAWNAIQERKKDPGYTSEIAPQFEFNRYMRAFMQDNPGLSRNDAIHYWKLKRATRGTNEYERSDLKLGQHE